MAGEVSKATGMFSVEYDDSQVAQGIGKTAQIVDANTAKMDKAAAKAKASTDQLNSALQNLSKTKLDALAVSVERSNRRIAESNAKAAKSIDVLEKKAQIKERGAAATVEEISARQQLNIRREVGKRITTEVEEQEKRQTSIVRANEQIRVDTYRDGLVQRRRLQRQEEAEVKRTRQQFARNFGSFSDAFFGDLNRGIAARNMQQQAATQGIPLSQLWQQQMNAAIARSNATNANFFAMQGQPPLPPRRGGGGFFGGLGGRLLGAGGGGVAGSLIGGLASGFGIGLGGMAIARGVQGTVAAAELATAYDRQRIAAQNLAGSQAQLNDLLVAYNNASGGAVDSVTALANVTRLLGTGFAQSVPEVEKFVRATRGASIALGKPQEYIIQETQLALSNTSMKRLDQIGLGIEEVTTRIEDLRRANSGMTREMAFQEAVLGLLDQKYGALTKSAEGQATGIEKLRKEWHDAGLTFGQAAQGPVNQLANGFLMLMKAIQDANNALVQYRRTEREMGFRTADALGLSGLPGRFMSLIHPEFGPAPTRAQINARRILDNPGIFGWPSGAPRGDSGEGSGFRPLAPRGRPDEQLAAIRDAYDAIADLERSTARQRLSEIESYEEQRSNIIRNYGKSVVREEEDFARQRARSLRDYERAIVDVMRDAQRRDADLQEDLDKRLADIREDGAERVQEIEEKYQKNREKAEKDHRDRLLKAAGQLDAIAVLEERKRWNRENEEREEAHDEALDEVRKSQEKQTEEALEAHRERLEDAREADARRLEDMRVARERQLADEDEDRRIRLERQAEDHADQLAELDRQHALRLAQIEQQAAEERAALQDALMKDLAEVGIYIAGYEKLMKERDKLMEQWLENFLDLMELKLRDEREKIARQRPPFVEREHFSPTNPNPVLPMIPGFAQGGPVLKTGIAKVHAGEYVLPADMVARHSVAAIGGATSNYSNSRSITIAPGAIAITTTPGMEWMVGDIVEQKVIELLERA